MKDIYMLDQAKAYIVGKFVTKEVLHGSMWSVGRSLHSQGREVYKNSKKSPDFGRQFVDPDGFVKLSNPKPNYFCYVNTYVHKMNYPEQYNMDKDTELIGPVKLDGWIDFGYIYFVLYSPRAKRELNNSKESACF
jgi:hypothetical protein